MVAKKPSAKSTKTEILTAYDELTKEKAALKSQLDRIAKEQPFPVKEKEIVVVPNMNKSQMLQQKMNYTIENLGKIQLGFGSAVSELSEQLTTEASKLQEIRRAIATEQQQLQSLHNLQVADNTFDSLIKSYEENYKAFGEEFDNRKETVEQELLEENKAWAKEQEEHKNSVKGRNETQNKKKNAPTRSCRV